MHHFATSFFLALASRFKTGGIIVNGHTLTRDQTRLQLQVLGRWFDFVGLEELPQRLIGPVRKPFCLLTFDDGERNNFTEVAPELERHGVPAVFFVATGPVSNGTWFWFDRRDLLVQQLGFCPPGLELPTLKKLPFKQLMRRLDDACARHSFTPPPEADELRPMTWDQVRDLARRGFIIGAHGQSHSILTNETTETALSEIEGSIAAVGAELRTPCRTFAFPNGNYTPDLARHALRCGATTVMTTDPTWADCSSPFWRLPRIQLFGESTRARIELKITVAAVRGALANPNGTGRAYFRKSSSTAPPRRTDLAVRYPPQRN